MRVCLPVLIAAVAGTAVHAQVFPFVVFENADGVNVAGLDLSLTLIDSGSHVDFMISNNSTIGGVVTGIAVEDPGISPTLSGMTILPVGVGPDWSISGLAVPGSIAGFSGPWNGTLGAVRADPPPVGNGIATGEFLTLRFSLGSSSFDDVVDAVSAQSLRLVMHIQALGENNQFSVWGTTVPSPATAALLLGGLVVASRRRR